MAKYIVTFGRHRVTTVAGDAYEAAAEVVSGWVEQRSAPGGDGPLGLEVRVASDERGARIERFSTFSLLAHLNQEPVEAAWKRLCGDLALLN